MRLNFSKARDNAEPCSARFALAPLAAAMLAFGAQAQQPASSPAPVPVPSASAPGATVRSSNVVREIEAERDKTPATGEAISVNFDQLSLPAFIQTVFGTILKRPVSVDPAVASRTDLVTFRAAKAMTPADLSRTSRQLLKTYGVAVQDFDGLVRFTPDSNTTAYLPQVRRGRAQPDVPAQLRPMFHYVELEMTRINEVSPFLKAMFGERIKIVDDVQRNALLISGQPEDVFAAIEVGQLFDQPLMRGTKSLRLSPVNWQAEEFARRLVEVLQAQGIGAAMRTTEPSPLLVLPIAAINSVFVFSGSDEVMAHAVKWANELDRSVANSNAGGLFTYQVKHTDAVALQKVFAEVMGAAGAAPAAPAAGQPGAATAAAPARVGALTTPAGLRIVVNPSTNSLIIQGGQPDQYRQWTQLLNELDRPTRSAMIEVVVAELTLSNNSSLGVEWALQDLLRRNGSAALSTLGGLGVATQGGLSLVLRDSARAVRGLVNALAADSNARILSSPKIIAKNGESATIQVGQEVPVITSQQAGGSGSGAFGGIGNSGVLQQIQYRSTGVILKVKPVIHSNSRLDLEVSQEVSGAASTQTGVSASPTISNRKVETRLSMRDGSTVLLAGLISDNQSGAETGVPGAKDVPLLGNLFKSQSKSTNRTELIILVTSYILNDDHEAEAITDAFRSGLGEWSRDTSPVSRPLRPVLTTPGTSPTSAPASAAPDAPALGQRVEPKLNVQPAVDGPPIRTRYEPTRPALAEGVRGDRAQPVVSAGTATPAANPAANPSSAPQPLVTAPGGITGRAVMDVDLIQALEAARTRSPK